MFCRSSRNTSLKLIEILPNPIVPCQFPNGMFISLEGGVLVCSEMVSLHRGSCSARFAVVCQILRCITIKVKQIIQWEFQDPQIKVLYHIKPYLVDIFPYIVLHSPDKSALFPW